jgi:hypothetical protein
MAFLRGRPWLAPCLMTMCIGASVLARSSYPYVEFWAGICVLVSGVVGIISGEAELKRRRTTQKQTQP